MEFEYSLRVVKYWVAGIQGLRTDYAMTPI